MNARTPVVPQDETRPDDDIFGAFPRVRLEKSPTEPAIEESDDPVQRNYKSLREDAQATYRAFRFSPRLASLEEWEATVSKGADDHISGRALLDQLGGEMFVDAQTAGVLLAIRRGLIEETNASTASDYMLMDMAIINYANALRMQRIVGNTALLIEAEFFGQEPLSKQVRRERGRWNATINGLSVEEHITRLREDLMPLVERFQRMAERQIEMLTQRRNEPAAHLEQLLPLRIVVE